MSALAWILVIAAIAVVIVALFVIMRMRQRRGDVFAAAPASRKGSSQ